jgi:hypothetical protein
MGNAIDNVTQRREVALGFNNLDETRDWQNGRSHVPDSMRHSNISLLGLAPTRDGGTAGAKKKEAGEFCLHSRTLWTAIFFLPFNLYPSALYSFLSRLLQLLTLMHKKLSD